MIFNELISPEFYKKLISIESKCQKIMAKIIQNMVISPHTYLNSNSLADPNCNGLIIEYEINLTNKNVEFLKLIETEQYGNCYLDCN